jgi:hypothetical protein
MWAVSKVVNAQALALDAGHQQIGIVLEELDARHGDASFKPFAGLCKGGHIRGEATQIGIQG